MALIQLIFRSNKTADHLIAGVPAVARAVRNLVELEVAKPGDEVSLVTLDETELSAWSITEIERLAPNIHALRADGGGWPSAPCFDGDRLAIGECVDLSQGRETGDKLASAAEIAGILRDMRRSSNAILKATGKASDGWVSRYLNRPISRFVSRYWLRLPGVTPLHGTVAALLIGVAMAGFLFFGGAQGVVIGAILFQLASVIDGVDGEIARATFRSSESGAKLDTLCDAATNLAFIGGLTFNLWQRGETEAGSHGLVGMCLLAIGLILLGWRSLAQGKGLNFDLVKNEFRGRPSRLQNVLASVTSRDVYALAFAILAVLGFAANALTLFALAVGVWFLVITFVLARTRLASS